MGTSHNAPAWTVAGRPFTDYRLALSWAQEQADRYHRVVGVHLSTASASILVYEAWPCEVPVTYTLDPL